MGPLLFHEKDAPRYAPGFTAVTATAIATAVLAVCYRYLAMWENNRRDKSGVAESYEHAYDDDLTDIKVSKGSAVLLHLKSKFTADVR